MECPICFEQRAFLQTLNGCRHTICKSCVDTWSKTAQTCPFCRGSLGKKCIAVVRIWHENSRYSAMTYVNNMTYDREKEYVKIALTDETLDCANEKSAQQIFYRHS